MSCRRCSMCGVCWPVGDYKAAGQPVIDFTRCPSCGEKTDYFANSNPDGTMEEMASLAKRGMFERYYQEEHVPKLEAAAAAEREQLARHLDAELDFSQVLDERAK